jgi:prepilin-type N-terminal cleavage/methylation domain-containing protein/prepilin-type processing-associated H-X9-DG protein
MTATHCRIHSRASSAHNSRSRFRRGFTLVEMLVVISLIVVLASLALPVVLRAREAGRSTQCLSNLRQLYLGLQMYHEANKVYPPYRWEDPSVINKYGVVRPRWQWIIADYLGRPAQDPDLVATALALPGADTTCTLIPLNNEIFFDPALPENRSIRNGAYGYNFQYLGNSRNMVDGDITTPTLNFPVRPVTDPGRTICFADSRGGGQPHGGHSMTLDPPHMRKRLNGSTVNSPSPSALPGYDPYGPDETGTDIEIYFSPVESRHNGRGNVVFLDGHVESQTLEDLGYVVSGGVAQPQTTTTLPWGTNRLWTGQGRDETSQYFNKN